MGLTDADLYWLRRSYKNGVQPDEWDAWWEENGARLESSMDARLLSKVKALSPEGVPVLLQQHGLSLTVELPPRPTAEEFVVLAAALTHGVVQQWTEPLLISGYFARWDKSLVVPITRLQQWLSRDAKGRTAWDDLVFKNQDRFPAGGQLELPLSFTETPSSSPSGSNPRAGLRRPPPDMVQWLKQGKRWDEIQERYGTSAVLSLCRVGFGAEGREAVACFSRYSAPRSGTGYRAALHKGPAGWVVKELETTWSQ
jgi:hypothetical protein